jgi:TonB family protein
MSAAPKLALEAPPRAYLRHPINVSLDLIALRSGVPENLPGRCTDISERGVGAVVAGEMAVGQQVAVELRLPNVGVPLRVRALVRNESRLRCGLEFAGLSLEQREMIRYWIHRSSPEAANLKVDSRQYGGAVAGTEAQKDAAAAPVIVGHPKAGHPIADSPERRVRIGRRELCWLAAFGLALAALGWWQWQRSWSQLEVHAQAAQSRLRVSPETMEKRIVTKVEPAYPEAARTGGVDGWVMLDAVIAADGSVKQLRPVFGRDLLVESATKAVKVWKYEPYLSNGRPVEVETTITIEFRLN